MTDKALPFLQDVAKTAAEICPHLCKDSATYAQFALSLGKTAELFSKAHFITPPRSTSPPKISGVSSKTGRRVSKPWARPHLDLLRCGSHGRWRMSSPNFRNRTPSRVIAARGIFGAALGHGPRIAAVLFCAPPTAAQSGARQAFSAAGSAHS